MTMVLGVLMLFLGSVLVYFSVQESVVHSRPCLERFAGTSRDSENFFPDRGMGSSGHGPKPRIYVEAGEPSLWQASQNPANRMYRLAFIPSFHDSVIVRIDLTNPDRAILETVWFPSSSYPGFLKEQDQKQDLTYEFATGPPKELTDLEIGQVLRLIHDSPYWSTCNSYLYVSELDGATVILEAADGGNYQFVATNDSERAWLIEIGRHILKLARADRDYDLYFKDRRRE